MKAVIQWVLRTMMKDQTGIVRTMPKKDLVDFNVAMTMERLMRNGIDPNSLKNANQVENAINQIEAPRNVQQGIKSTKSAKVFNIEGKELDPKKPIIGGTQTGKELSPELSERLRGTNVDRIKQRIADKKIDDLPPGDDDLPPPGSRGGPDDIAAPIQSADESLRDMMEAEIKKKLETGNKKGIARIRARQKMLNDAIDDASPGFSGDRKVDAELVAENLAERMGLVYDDLPTKQRLDLYDQAYTGLSKKRQIQRESLEDFVDDAGGVDPDDPRGIDDFIPDDDPEPLAQGGRAGFSNGGIDVLKIEDEALQRAINAFKYYQSMGGKKNFRDYLRESGRFGDQFRAEGGRIGFKDGMTRRTFLKILGGAMSIPIIGKFLAPMKVGKTVTKVPMIKTDNVPGKPEWFDALVNKVIMEGDDVTKTFATGERQSIHQKRLDDGSVVRVTEDIDDGAVRVEYESETNVFGDTATMQYKKPLPDEGDPRPTAEFTTAESGPVGRSYGPDDYEIEVDEVGGTSIRDLDSDVSKLKEYATGKKLTMKEIVESKKRRDKAKAITEDPAAQSDAVIRRQGDADDSYYGDPDEFASGGIARMLGE
jgi:hypothetical protein